eukprot:CAMPEP_0201874176 /NCGR_PEP_ID=MMETSP0902-20130614/6504_1 /ASSEMBLY_ACC=CAM_ASM_000551 /TAXON_ID=420261 /ORGANISM="Thalassiosira antarctica, Strain CCMP982" /LENGTH=403 /DNA_ID=CAMNT_0048400987 /DNA_START=354 /DNA_END=1565 /DNA_ORIENTATION=-
MALAIIAIVSCPSPTNSLAFDISSRSSSTFTSSSTAQICHTSATTNNGKSCLLQMKVNASSSKSSSSKSSVLIELNNQRLQTAGKPGSKKFQDPNKVFLGNLPYDATEEDVSQLFATHYNIPLESVGDRIESIKIIRDWKTGKSKGYGFIQFYEPMAATSAMESVNKGSKQKGWRIKGRKIRLDQGVRKPNEEVENRKRQKINIKKKKKAKLARGEGLDEEGMVIHSVLEDVDGNMASDDGGGGDVTDDDDSSSDGLGMSEDDMITFMEKGGLRGVMPLTEETAGFLGIEGLYDDDEYDEDEGYFESFYNENGYSDGDFENINLDNEDSSGLDGAAEGDDDGDGEEEIVYDGVFEEEYNPNEYEGLSEEEAADRENMNREKRRAQDKKRKKRKLPFKGFGKSD